jgi:hypothetical protein
MTHNIKSTVVWCIPCGFVLLGICRSIAIRLTFRNTAQYIAGIERYFSKTFYAPSGWEAFSSKTGPWISVTAFVFWLALAAATIAVPFMKDSLAVEVPATQINTSQHTINPASQVVEPSAGQNGSATPSPAVKKAEPKPTTPVKPVQQ